MAALDARKRIGCLLEREGCLNVGLQLARISEPSDLSQLFAVGPTV
jgi:hypothetical protein